MARSRGKLRRGDAGIVGINKCGTPVDATVSMDNSVLHWHVPYTDALDAGNTIVIDRAAYTFRLPPRQARMWRR